jgi:hypothetical protein
MLTPSKTLYKNRLNKLTKYEKYHKVEYIRVLGLELLIIEDLNSVSTIFNW